MMCSKEQGYYQSKTTKRGIPKLMASSELVEQLRRFNSYGIDAHLLEKSLKKAHGIRLTGKQFEENFFRRHG